MAFKLRALENSETGVISIVGCGRVGSAAARYFLNKGFFVRAVSRSPLHRQIEHSQFRFFQEVVRENSGFLFTDGFVLSSHVLICLPPSAGYDAFEQITQALNSSFEGQILLISSTSVYGDLSGRIKEGDGGELNDNKRAELQLKIEQLFAHRYSKLTILRCGGLVGQGRHPGRFFSSGKGKGNGMQMVNMVDERDVARAVFHLSSKSKFGVYNCVFPEHPSKQKYYSEAARALGLSDIVFPEIPGADGVERIVDSSKLIETGFEFENSIENFSDF